jgi:hypothetical protein
MKFSGLYVVTAQKRALGTDLYNSLGVARLVDPVLRPEL